MADKVDQRVVDEFRRDSFLLDRLTFDNAVSPGTGGSTLTYGYTMLKTPSTAARRVINSEYVAGEAERKRMTADLDIFGGAFEVDRVIQNTSGAVNEIEFQLTEKVKAATNLFHYAVVNGEVKTGSRTTAGFIESNFDGLRKLCAGTSTEVDAAAAGVNLYGISNINANMDAFVLLINQWLQKFAEKPDMLLMNGDMIAIMEYVAQKMGYYTRSEDAFGNGVSNYKGIALVDAGKFYNGSAEVDVVATEAGLSSIIGVKLGLDGFHGISPIEVSAIVKSYLPDLNAPGAVKKGEAELVAGVVLKNSRKAGILKGIQIGATS